MPQGVFLFLGYSEADESLLKPLIKMEVQDAAMSLQSLIKRSLKPKVINILFSINEDRIEIRNQY